MVVVLVVMMEDEYVLDEVKGVVVEGCFQKYFRWGSNPCLLRDSSLSRTP